MLIAGLGITSFIVGGISDIIIILLLFSLIMDTITFVVTTICITLVYSKLRYKFTLTNTLFRAIRYFTF